MANETRKGRPTYKNAGGPDRLVLFEGPAGQRTEMTVEAAMIERISIGVSLRGSCEAVGLPWPTFLQWMRDGAEHEAAGRETRSRAFRSAIARARATCRTVYAKQIAAAAPHDWRAASWMLERQFPAEYGERQQISVDGGLLAPLVLVRDLSIASLTIGGSTESSGSVGEAQAAKTGSLLYDPLGDVK